MASIPDPTPGLVISYVYLWRQEAAKGRDEGSKKRPCAVVLAAQPDEGGGKMTLSCRSPIARRTILPLRSRFLQGPGIVSELNRFEWPGPDLHPVAPGRWTYGHLPAGLFRTVRNRLVELANQRRLARIQRDP